MSEFSEHQLLGMVSYFPNNLLKKKTPSLYLCFFEITYLKINKFFTCAIKNVELCFCAVSARLDVLHSHLSERVFCVK